MKSMLLLSLALVLSLDAHAAEGRRRKGRHETPPPPPARATGQNMAGCGLGSLAIQDNSKWAQVGASLLNGTGMQSFGITFGTSNCTEDGVASADRERDVFVEANLSDIRRDLSAGRGEYLASLASFYGCRGDSVGDFTKALRKHRDRLQAAPAAAASRVIDSAVSEEHAGCRVQS